MTKTLHITMQSKGGVGKTLAARFVADWLIEREGRDAIRIMDADQQTSTLSRFEGYGAQPVPFFDEANDYDIQQAEAFFEEVLSSDSGTILMDIGAGGFVPFVNYALQTDLFAIFRDAGYDIYLHVPIAAGGSLPDTISGFDALCENFGDATKIVAWINPHFGPVRSDDGSKKPFEEMGVYKEHEAKIHGVVELPVLKEFGAVKDFAAYEAERAPFSQVRKSKTLNSFQKPRIEKLYRHVADQLTVMFAAEDAAAAEAVAADDREPRAAKSKAKVA